MNEQKVAIVVDTGCDVPQNYLDRPDVFCLPFRIIYKDREYTDGVDITAQEIYERLPVEIPTTSLPSGQDIYDTYERIKEAGFTHVLAVTVSSKLSGTFNMVQLMANSFTGLTFHIVDTKNVGIAAGFFAVDAIHCLDAGMDFLSICTRLEKQVPVCKVFFSIDTLEYLQKGGRIGLVSAILGTALQIKPVISCNKEGVYYTVKKSRGRKQSFKHMIQCLQDALGDHKRFLLAASHSNSPIEMMELKRMAEEALPKPDMLLTVPVGAGLGIHVGPGMVGLGIYPLPE